MAYKNDCGWDLYGPETFNGLEVRRTLLIELCGFVVVKLRNPEAMNECQFDGTMKASVTSDELRQLTEVMETFAKRWLEYPQPRPKIIGNSKKVWWPLAELSFEEVLPKIRDFNFDKL